jgi:quercetin dioxygenase-like cupin family protein
MSAIIRIGQIEIRFLETRHDTNGTLDLFEMTVPPRARVPAAHYHRDFDETLYGLEGVLRSTRDGALIDVGPGDHLFINRGVTHGFDNPYEANARVLVMLTPGLIGPEYFEAMAAIVGAGGPPDQARIRATMERFGLIPIG